MKRFSFRLQSVLRYRQYLERLAQQETAKANLDVALSQTRIETLKTRHLKVSGTLESESVKGISAAEFKAYRDYLESVFTAIQLEKKNKIRLQKVLFEKQKVLSDKRIDKEVVERLRTKKEDLYMDGLRKEEQKLLDEISSLKKAREAQDDRR